MILKHTIQYQTHKFVTFSQFTILQFSCYQKTIFRHFLTYFWITDHIFFPNQGFISLINVFILTQGMLWQSPLSPFLMIPQKELYNVNVHLWSNFPYQISSFAEVHNFNEETFRLVIFHLPQKKNLWSNRNTRLRQRNLSSMDKIWNLVCYNGKKHHHKYNLDNSVNTKYKSLIDYEIRSVLCICFHIGQSWKNDLFLTWSMKFQS